MATAPSRSAEAAEHVACLCGADRPRRLFVKHGFAVVRCTACGLSYVTPRPPLSQLRRIYLDEGYYCGHPTMPPPARASNICAFGYDDYLADHALLKPLFAERMAAIEARRPGRGRLLDVGCATGLLLDEARARGWDVQGVEVSDFAVVHARRLGLSVHHGDVRAAGFAAGSFDVVVMDDTIEHLPDPRVELAEVRRVLVAGGLLTINTPNEAGLLRRLMRRYWFHYKPPEHLYYFSARTLGGLLGRCGFRVTGSALSGKIVSAEHLLGRLRAYSPSVSRLLLATLGRLPGAARPFFLPIGEFLVFAERV